MQDYVPPHDLEAEKFLLSAILSDPKAIEQVALELRSEDFYRTTHGEIYQACLDLHSKNKPFDVITVGAFLASKGALERIGGRTELATLRSYSSFGGLLVSEHSGIIRDKARLREAFRVLNSGIVDIVRGESNSITTIDRTIKQLFDLALDSANTNVERVGERDVGTFLETLNQSEKPVGLSWPWPALDDLLSGLWPSEMTVVCGRPGMAKSSLAMNLAMYLTMECKLPVGIFSLEMSKLNLVNRMLSQLASVDSVRMRDHAKGKTVLTDEEMQRIYEASIPLSDAPLYIDDDPGLTETDLMIKARKLKWQANVSCIMIDYLQLLKPSGKFGNREQEVSSFSSTARYIARELQIPVIVLCQLNRAPEIRPDHRPMLSDLRESGALEQDADIVIGLYRDSYYNPDANPLEAEVIVLKHRNGPTDTVKLGFDKRLTRFYAL